MAGPHDRPKFLSAVLKLKSGIGADRKLLFDCIPNKPECAKVLINEYPHFLWNDPDKKPTPLDLLLAAHTAHTPQCDALVKHISGNESIVIKASKTSDHVNKVAFEALTQPRFGSIEMLKRLITSKIISSDTPPSLLHSSEVRFLTVCAVFGPKELVGLLLDTLDTTQKMPNVYTNGSGTVFRPKNYDNAYHHNILSVISRYRQPNKETLDILMLFLAKDFSLAKGLKNEFGGHFSRTLDLALLALPKSPEILSLLVLAETLAHLKDYCEAKAESATLPAITNFVNYLLTPSKERQDESKFVEQHTSKVPGRVYDSFVNPFKKGGLKTIFIRYAESKKICGTILSPSEIGVDLTHIPALMKFFTTLKITPPPVLDHKATESAVPLMYETTALKPEPDPLPFMLLSPPGGPAPVSTASKIPFHDLIMAATNELELATQQLKSMLEQGRDNADLVQQIGVIRQCFLKLTALGTHIAPQEPLAALPEASAPLGNPEPESPTVISPPSPIGPSVVPFSVLAPPPPENRQTTPETGTALKNSF